MSKEKRFVLLEPEDERLACFQRLDGWVCRTPTDISEAVKAVPRSSLWISFRSEVTDHFLQAVQPSRLPVGRLLALKPPRPQSLPALSGYFQSIIGMVSTTRFLPDEELVEVLTAPREKAPNLFLAGMVDKVNGILTLMRGNLQPVVVPLSIFHPNDTGMRPDPSRFRLTDYGQAVRLGDYEASADSILYEVDPRYRARINARRKAAERTFGASLRRLRRMKGLTQYDFLPVSKKTIARIEANEIQNPHKDTLRTIARQLGVKAEEIGSY